MAKIRYQSFAVTGSANATVYDSGIESTEAEPKKVRALWLHVSGQVGNYIEGWREQERVFRMPDYLVVTDESAGSTDVQKVTNRAYRFELDEELPLGQRFQVAINCGATAKNLYGAYEYEIVE